MAIHGPIILIEDDKNDAEVFISALQEIGIRNEVKVIPDCHSAYDFLCTTRESPYIILCDIRMPGMDGMAFRKKIVNTEFLRKKSIPFVFFTGIASQDMVNEAYDLDVQGFFEKAHTYGAVRDQLLSIFVYWKQCLHPNRTPVLEEG